MKKALRWLFAAVLATAVFPMFAQSGRARDWGPATLQAVQAELPAFPNRLLHYGVTHGTVEVLFEVQTDGTVGDRLVTAYTHRDFARATEAAIERWRFQPTDVVHIVELTLNFETRGVLVVVKRHQAEAGGDAYVFRPCPPGELDRRPQPVNQVSPAYSERMEAEGTVGTVTVRYFIDEEGRVRLPYALEAADPLLAAIAVQAVKQWRFEPPRCHGRPTLVRAEQAFRFGQTATGPSTGSDRAG